VTYFPERQIVRIARRREAKGAPELDTECDRRDAWKSCPARETQRTFLMTPARVGDSMAVERALALS